MTRALVFLLTALLTWVVHPLPAGAEVGVVDIPVRAGSDDAEQVSGSGAYLTSGDLELVADGSKVQTVGLRFTGVNIPKGSAITDAYVQFQVDEATTATASMTVAGQAADDPGTFTTAVGDVTGRQKTAATVAWSPEGWPTVGARARPQQTPDLAPVVQEIVDRPGWASGNAVVVLLTGTGTRTAESYEGGASKAPVLHIEYGPSAGGGTTNQPPVVSAGPDTGGVVSADVALAGSVTDPEGQPVTAAWSTVSAPAGGTVTFANAAAASTSARFSAAGDYVLRLTGRDGTLSATDDVLVKVTSSTSSTPSGGGVLDIPVRAGSDDAEQVSGSGAYLTSGDLELVADGSKVQTVGLRFTGVDVPKGSAITDAYVQFQVDEATTATASMTVAGQAADDPGTFTTAVGNVSTRSRTTATTLWAADGWPTVGARTAAQRTPDLAAVVQEIVTRPGWTGGNAMVVLLTGTGTRTAESYEGGASKAPVLHIEYGPSSGGSGGTNQAPVVDAGPAELAVTMPDAAALAGSVTDPEGQPVTAAWAEVSGPGDVFFANAAAASTTATFSAAGDYVLRLTGSDGTLSATDDVLVKVTSSTTSPPSGGGIPTPADYGFPGCTGPDRTVVRPFPQGTVLTTGWRESAPPDDTTYNLTGVFSTAQPSTQHPFSFGTGNDNLAAGDRTCFVGGELRDMFGDPPPDTWEYYHYNVNAACLMGASYGRYQVLDTVCRGVEDGFRLQEPGVNANNARFAISDTYLGNIFDDCLENDYTVGGVVLDSLWESCFTGVSERPSLNRCWDTPSDEQLVLDHLLLGLRPMAHDDGRTAYGRLFKWERCTENTANQLVLKCSTFMVPDFGMSGVDSMGLPAGTVVDDSACPNDPTTIVWLGGGSVYPGDLQGLPIRVLTDRNHWDAKVAAWKAEHGM